MKKVLSVLLAGVLSATMLAGCTKTVESTVEPAESVAESVETETPAAEESSRPEDHVTLKMYFHGSNVTDDSDVMAKVNEYLDEKLNVTLEPVWGTWGDFDTNAVLALQSGDPIDIYFTCSWSANEYNKYSADGYYVRLDDPNNNLIEKYGKELWKTLPSALIDGAYTNGKDGLGVYAVPGYKDIANMPTYDVNVPLLEKYGYTVADIENTDFYGFEEIMKKVKEGEEAETGETFYPLNVEGAVLERIVNSTPIVTGDAGSTNLLSYYFYPDDPSKEGPYGNKILNKFATDEYKKFATQMHKYFEEGFVNPALATDSAADVRQTAIDTGKYLIGTQVSLYGYDVTASKARGYQVAFVQACVPYVDTTSAQGAMMAISKASENPERAMMFLNLLNTDPYLMTLLNYGIEGVHYNLNDQGEAVFTDARGNYAPWTNGVGNVTILPPTEGQGSDFQTEFKNFYGASVSIPLTGFIFSQDNVADQVAACANAAAQYALPLSIGAVDPEVAIPELLDKLEANGIDTIVEEANSQLATFLASK